MTTNQIERGKCLCGCGAATRIAPVNDRSKNWVKGEPLMYLKGHRLKAGASGDKSPRWKGGRYLSTHGYVVITTEVGRKYEHILMAEKVLGRPLLHISTGHPDNEVVHHIDGDKTGNRPGNLLICTHRYHTELHHLLEQSPAWPEFKNVVRNSKEKSSANR